MKTKQFSHNTFSKWKATQNGVSQGQKLGLFTFFPWHEWLSVTINIKSKPIIFTDGTSIIFITFNLEDFKNYLKLNMNH
jgi:hypothetical protein